MPNEFRSQSQMGGRVDYVKAGKPKFDLAAEAAKVRKEMGGGAAPTQPASPNKAKQSGASSKPAPPSIDRIGVKPRTVDEQMKLADEMEK